MGKGVKIGTKLGKCHISTTGLQGTFQIVCCTLGRPSCLFLTPTVALLKSQNSVVNTEISIFSMIFRLSTVDIFWTF